MQNLQTHAPSRYATPTTNGNGNGNGDHTPADDTREELIKDIAPKIRRRVREDSELSAGAKFLFFCLLDDCFWHKVGGHGTGRIFDTLRRIAKRYRHNKSTVAEWRDELIKREWLYCRHEWPLTEWRLTPLMPAPDDSPHQAAVQMSLGKAAKEDNDQDGEGVRNSGQPPANGAKPAFPARSSGKAGEPVRKTGSPSPEKRDSVSGKPDQCVRKSGQVVAGIPDTLSGTSGRSDPEIRTDSPGDPDALAGKTAPSPTIQARPIGQNEPRENTPRSRESGGKEQKGGEGKGTTTPREEAFSRKYPMPVFEPLDWGMFQSRRDKFAEAGIALAKQERIYIANDPLSKHPGEEKFHAAAAAVRMAYRDRIELLKKFAAGQKVSQ